MALRSLARHGVALPPHAFDVRGWEARTEVDDGRVGRIEDLLLDGAGTPRHVVVALRQGDMGHVLVPLSHAWADASKKTVWIRRLDEDALDGMPRYAGDPDAVSHEMEARLLEEYGRGGGRERAASAAARGELARLGDLEELRVAKGSTDPRGWTVVGGDGQKIGTVAELLVDRSTMRARYVDCDVNEDRLELERLDRHVLLPVDRVRLDHDERRVVVDGLFGRDLAMYPIYRGLPLAQDDESEIGGWFDRDRTSTGTTADWAEPAARRFFSARRRPAGEASEPAEGAEREGRDEPVRSGEGGTVRVRLPEDGDVKVRVVGDEILIERSGEGGRRG